jgi:hypothetical protein
VNTPSVGVGNPNAERSPTLRRRPNAAKASASQTGARKSGVRYRREPADIAGVTWLNYSLLRRSGSAPGEMIST